MASSQAIRNRDGLGIPAFKRRKRWRNENKAKQKKSVFVQILHPHGENAAIESAESIYCKCGFVYAAFPTIKCEKCANPYNVTNDNCPTCKAEKPSEPVVIDAPKSCPRCRKPRGNKRPYSWSHLPETVRDLLWKYDAAHSASFFIGKAELPEKISCLKCNYRFSSAIVNCPRCNEEKIVNTMDIFRIPLRNKGLRQIEIAFHGINVEIGVGYKSIYGTGKVSINQGSGGKRNWKKVGSLQRTLARENEPAYTFYSFLRDAYGSNWMQTAPDFHGMPLDKLAAFLEIPLQVNWRDDVPTYEKFAKGWRSIPTIASRLLEQCDLRLLECMQTPIEQRTTAQNELYFSYVQKREKLVWLNVKWNPDYEPDIAQELDDNGNPIKKNVNKKQLNEYESAIKAAFDANIRFKEKTARTLEQFNKLSLRLEKSPLFVSSDETSKRQLRYAITEIAERELQIIPTMYAASYNVQKPQELSEEKKAAQKTIVELIGMPNNDFIEWIKQTAKAPLSMDTGKPLAEFSKDIGHDVEHTLITLETLEKR